MGKAKIHRVVLKVLNFEGSDPEDIAVELERNKYYCVNVMRQDVTETEWDDDHPCNKSSMTADQFDKWMLDNTPAL